MYALGLGSPTYPLPTESYAAWTATYEWKDTYGYECLYGGPLFIHQYSHIWVDFRGIQDAFARDKGIDYFENSRRATYVQREYAIRNPLEFAGYGGNFWGLTASDGPGWTTRRIRGIERAFFDYVARGAPYGPDDGTIAPWAVVALLPFAPEIVLPTVQHFQDVYPQLTGEYCFRCSFNLTFVREGDAGVGWTSPYHFGINLGPVVLMCENYRSDLLWRLMRACPYIVTGLRRAGFRNGWLWRSWRITMSDAMSHSTWGGRSRRRLALRAGSRRDWCCWLLAVHWTKHSWRRGSIGPRSDGCLFCGVLA